MPFYFEIVCQGLMFVATQMLVVCVIFPLFSGAVVIAAGQSLKYLNYLKVVHSIIIPLISCNHIPTSVTLF